MSTYPDVKARCARIVTRLEAIATDPNATPADPRDLFIRLELLSHEPRGATFRVREWLVADEQRWKPSVTLRSRRQCGWKIALSNKRQLAHAHSAALENAKREAEAALRELPCE